MQYSEVTIYDRHPSRTATSLSGSATARRLVDELGSSHAPMMGGITVLRSPESFAEESSDCRIVTPGFFRGPQRGLVVHLPGGSHTCHCGSLVPRTKYFFRFFRMTILQSGDTQRFILGIPVASATGSLGLGVSSARFDLIARPRRTPGDDGLR